MATTILLFIAGLVCAGFGGEFFLKGSVSLATYLRLPVGVIGATIAAFATSSPEAAVSVGAALSGTPSIALGDALGSNIVNLGLVLALVILWTPVAADKSRTLPNFVAALVAPCLLFLLALDGRLSRLDAVILLSTFTLWLALVIHRALRTQKTEASQEAHLDRRKAILLSIVGILLLMAAGNLIVVGAKGLAEQIGLSPFFVGVTIVALGTSTPELATVIIARLRGHAEMDLSLILGSSIFNGLFIIGIAVAIHPIERIPPDLVQTLGVGFCMACVCIPWRERIGRLQGALLLLGYATYIAFLSASK